MLSKVQAGTDRTKRARRKLSSLPEPDVTQVIVSAVDALQAPRMLGSTFSGLAEDSYCRSPFFSCLRMISYV